MIAKKLLYSIYVDKNQILAAERQKERYNIWLWHSAEPEFANFGRNSLIRNRTKII